MKKERIAIIDNGINGKILNNKKMLTEIVIDENKNCKKEHMEIHLTDFQHGTICALILEKYYPDCILSSIQILDKKGKGEIEKIELAFEWCYQNGVTLINLSLGTTNFSDCEKLNKMINKYANKGLIIVAATSNTGFLTYPASFSNVIGVATTGSPIQYCNHYIHLGIDAVASSEHTIKMYDTDLTTQLSNSYATPFVCALVARKISMDGIRDIHALKSYVSTQTHLDIIGDLYEPDWVYKAYMLNERNKSKANYYFEVVYGNGEEIEGEIDTIITYSLAELEQIRLKNKNLIYLGEDDIINVQTTGFKWSQNTRVQQILNNKHHGGDLCIPIIFLDIEDFMDEYFIMSELKRLFKEDGYNAYAIATEAESILYRLEYIPDVSLPNQTIKDFIEGQVYYKQSDLILWSVAKEKKRRMYELYPDYDMEILFKNNMENTEVSFYIEKRLFRKEEYWDMEEHIKEIYAIIVHYLTEADHE